MHTSLAYFSRTLYKWPETAEVTICATWLSNAVRVCRCMIKSSVEARLRCVMFRVNLLTNCSMFVSLN